MAHVTDTAICLNQWDWSETSQTAALLTRGEGLVRVIAKGSKREKSGYSGGVGLLTLGECVYIERTKVGLVTLVSWDLRESFPWLRTSLSRLNAAYFASDILMHLLQEHDPHPASFDAAAALLMSMRDEAAMPALARFLWDVLDECGFRPELDRDVDTGAPLTPAPVYHFVPSGGGLAARRDGSGRGAWDVRGRTVECLRGVRDRGAAAPEDAWAGAAKLLASYAAYVVQKVPSAFEPVFGPPPRDLQRLE